jgi:Tfp pilus assembly protein PilW
MKQPNFSKGYSLIELLVYVSLFVLISIVIIQSLIFTMKTYANARAYRTLQQNGELVMERITREIRQASAVSTGSSTFGSSPGTLSLSGEDSVGTPYTATVSVSGGSVQLATSSVGSTLSSTEVTVSNLTFWNITTATSSAIKIELTLTTLNSPVISSKFYGTAVLRN